MLWYNADMIKLCQIPLFVLAFFMTATQAAAIEFLFPVSCQVMGNCWITNHVDLDDRIGRVQDYMCSDKATDNNQSTHISLAGRAYILKSPPVLAAADGRVIEAIDGYPDTAAPLRGESFCGNRILIRHDDGWETSYCHLRKDSLTVRPGETVRAGQPIARIGMSGQADWPRLSFATLRNGMVFDPFSGRTSIEGCSKETHSLWAGGINPPYEPASVSNAGFTVGDISNAAILNGTAQNATIMKNEVPRLSLWALMMNLRKGDRISMSVQTPDGRILTEINETVTEDSLYYPIYLSKRRGGFLWEPGEYKGLVTITRRVNGNDITSGRIATLHLAQ